MAKAKFLELRVYQLAEEVADAVYDAVRPWDRLDRNTVGEQLVRACDSVGANIAEGYGRGTPADNKRFVRIARGSLNETHHWLRRAFRRKLLTEDQVQRLKPLLDELGPKLNAYLKSIGRGAKPATSSLPPPPPKG